MRKRSKLDNNLKLFKERLQEKLGDNLIKIVLFGSRARGDNDEYSDYDCLVIVKENDKRIEEEILHIEANLLYEKDALFSAFAYSEKEMLKKKYEPFIINATREGIDLNSLPPPEHYGRKDGN